ncbi:MAG: DASS family sodium-coupled anion symporter [Nitrospinae bacterium]|nr:DASS family sodium-coupled anion symporter [Nitrospinota bacterium]
MNNGKYIDSRPLWLLFIFEYKNFFISLFATLFFFIILALPTPDGLSSEGFKTLAVFILVLCLWITQALPMSVTALLVFGLLPLLGVMDSNEAFSLFGNQAVFFILGAFFLAAAIMTSGLSTRIAFIFLNLFGSTPKRLLVGLMLSSAFFTFFIPEHAVAAIYLPIALEIARALHLKPGYSRYGKTLFLAVAWGCIMGGVATLLGGARNPLAIGILYEYNGQTISFMEWFLYASPITVCMLIIGVLIIKFKFKPDIHDISPATKLIASKLQEMGGMNLKEKLILVIFLGTVFCWGVWGEELGLAEIAIISVGLLFLFNLMTWEDVEENVNWGIILMYGGAIAIGKAMVTTGCALWLVNLFLPNDSVSPFLILIGIVVLAVFLTEGISNSAVVALLLPVCLILSEKFGIDPKLVTLAVAIPAGLAFMLPTSSPTNAICYSAGYYTISEIIKITLFLDISVVVVFTLVNQFLWSFSI